MIPEAAPLSDWLAWLETLSPSEIDLGLERVELVLERLQLERPAQLLLVAGTNGKGSSVAMMSALLRAAGKHVGAYTSPHIMAYNERIVVDAVAASDAEIISAFEAVEAVRGDTPLTYFEYGTLAAAVVFAAAKLDVWILEVGLGGRLDASNAFEPSGSLITNVSLDHCEWLGNDVETIATEKAGVMRAGRPAVYGGSPVPRAIITHAQEIAAELRLAGGDFHVERDSETAWAWHGSEQTFNGLAAPGLSGEFQIHNAAAVIALLVATGLATDMTPELINTALSGLRLAGRSQELSVGGSEWYLDVAHNEAAAEVLAQTLQSASHDGATIAIIGVLADKDLTGLVRPLLPHVDRWIALRADNPRAVPASELSRQIANQSGRSCLAAESVQEAVKFAQRLAAEDDRILVTGSFFTVGPVLRQLQVNSQSKS
ncbi:MAG: bifunctional folylpolyglutamate synthase/dihydrofolate synthase [Gammaproteobacteria bacterium]|nr:bifunctional folylpolyglutamate synthase/dihydrofolate synthase [Gammaproteobacteria bacterium]